MIVTSLLVFLAVTLGAAALLVMVFVRWPGLAVSILFLLLPLEWRTLLPLGDQLVPVSSTVVLVPVLLITALATGQLKRLKDAPLRVLAWYGAFLGVAALSLLNAQDPIYGARKLAELVLGFGVFVLVLSSVSENRDLQAFLTAATAALAAVSAVAVYQWSGGTLRATATFGHDAILGGFVALACPLTLALIWQRAFRPVARTAMSLLVLLVGFLVIGMSGARGAFIALGGATLALVWLLKGQSDQRPDLKFIAVLAVGLLLLPLVMVLTLADRPVAQFFDLTYATNKFRLIVWQGALDIFREHPILGVGYMNAGLALRGALNIKVFHSHNLYLELLIATGLMGLLAFVGFSLAYVREIRIGPKSAALACVGAGLVGFLLQGLVDFTLWDIRYSAPLSAVLALGIVVRHLPTSAALGKRGSPRLVSNLVYNSQHSI